MGRRIAIGRRLPGSILALCLLAPSAGALTFYGTQAAFTAASSTTLEATFESQSGGVNLTSPVAEGRVVCSSSMSALPFYVLKSGNPGDVCCTFPHVTSAMLSGNGNEDFDLTFTGPAPTAVGFNVTTYLGITSDVAIGRIHWFSQNLAPPSAQNSAVDNIRIGSNLAVGIQARSWSGTKVIYR